MNSIALLAVFWSRAAALHPDDPPIPFDNAPLLPPAALGGAKDERYDPYLGMADVPADRKLRFDDRFEATADGAAVAASDERLEEPRRLLHGSYVLDGPEDEGPIKLPELSMMSYPPMSMRRTDEPTPYDSKASKSPTAAPAYCAAYCLLVDDTCGDGVCSTEIRGGSDVHGDSSYCDVHCPPSTFMPPDMSMSMPTEAPTPTMWGDYKPTYTSHPTPSATYPPTVSLWPTFTTPRACEGADPNKCGCAIINHVDYRGTISVTKEGMECVRWDSDVAKKWGSESEYDYKVTPDEYPDAGLENNNYCRNPDSGASGTWCWTEESPGYGNCDIPSCPFMPPDMSMSMPTEAPTRAMWWDPPPAGTWPPTTYPPTVSLGPTPTFKPTYTFRPTPAPNYGD